MVVQRQRQTAPCWLQFSTTSEMSILFVLKEFIIGAFSSATTRRLVLRGSKYKFSPVFTSVKLEVTLWTVHMYLEAKRNRTASRMREPRPDSRRGQELLLRKGSNSPSWHHNRVIYEKWGREKELKDGFEIPTLLCSCLCFLLVGWKENVSDADWVFGLTR